MSNINCFYNYKGSCTDGRNDFDGLCGIEACELTREEKIKIFGLDKVEAFERYIEENSKYDR